VLLLTLAACITELPILADPCAEFPDPGLYKLSFDDEGRSVLIDLPSNSVGPRPMVVAVHGFRASATKMKDVTRFGVVGDEEGFISVFPNGFGSALGVNRSWNAGDCCPPAINKGYDDAAFLDKVITTLEQRVCADPERTYGAGHSNGGMMMLRMACETESLDGVLAASGPLTVDQCDGTPIPTMLFHGLADQVVLFEGGTANGGALTYRSSDETLAVFLERNQCQPEPRLVQVGSARCEEYTCEVPVRRCTIEDWGHGWAGGTETTRAGFNVTREAWSFFDGQPLE
jgi:polyhydroxybutyrate depolymerase